MDCYFLLFGGVFFIFDFCNFFIVKNWDDRGARNDLDGSDDRDDSDVRNDSGDTEGSDGWDDRDGEVDCFRQYEPAISGWLTSQINRQCDHSGLRVSRNASAEGENK